MSTPLLFPETGRTRTLRRWVSRLLALVLLALAVPAAQAQSVANYTFAASSGTYTALAGGTAAGVTSTDDAASGILPIGFSFVYNGVAYTTFSVSTNGFMGLGSQVASSAGNNLTTGTPRPIIAPLWDDNDIIAAANLTYLTSGTAGSRVLTVEWLNTKWNYQATAAVVSFQAKLYEADGHIDFVYRSEAGAINSASASIGITAVATGSGNFLSLSDAVAAPTASSTTETATIATKPATGQVYTFTPAGGTVAAPSGLTFSAVTTSTGTVTFTDNSTNEYSFAVTIAPTAGGAGTTTIVPSTTTAGTGTTYTATFSGLSANTGYTVSVVAIGQGRTSAAGTGTFTTQAGATLSGIYYVGTGTSPSPTRTYATLTAAANAYTTATLTGAVTFVLLDATYGTAETFPIVLGFNNSASTTNTLTIRPNTGVTPLITGSVATGAVLQLNGAAYVTLDGSNNATTSQNLTLENTSATGTGNTVLWLSAASAANGASFNTVRNMVIRGNSATGFPQFTVFVGGGGAGVTTPTASTPAANSNNTFTNNVIIKGFYGVFVFGVSATVLDQNNQFTNNQIGQNVAGNGFGLEGMRAVYQQNLLVQGNEIQNIVDASAFSHYGLRLANAVNATVNRNSVHNVQSNNTTSGNIGYGIALANTTNNTAASASNNLVSNNVIYNISAPLATTGSNPNVLGLANNGGYGDRVVFNTVLLNVAQTAGTGNSAAISNGDYLNGTNTANLTLLNNNVAITANVSTTASYYAFYTTATSLTGSTLNYNNYYLGGSGSATFRTAYFNGTQYATLANWQAGSGQEANSLAVNPNFTQASTVPFNLTPGTTALNNVGTPVTGVTTDFTGAPRSTTPDIGAYEFTPAANDLKPSDLTAPSASQACFSATEPLTVQIQNNGTGTINFAATTGTVTVVVTPPTGAAQTFTTTLTTGTLASGVTQSVTLPGTLNMTATGTYSFAITATVAGDANTANDNITVTRTNTAPTPLPYTEQFNGTTLPTGFTTVGFGLSTTANNGGATGSSGLRVNIYSGVTTASATTPILGATVSANNILTFDARFTNFNTTTGPATVLQAGDKLDVQVSVCGGSFTTVYTIDNTNQNGTGAASANFFTYTVPLTGVAAGQRVQVRFLATYGGTTGSDFYIDLDNLNVVSLVPTDVAANALVAPAQPNATTGACYGSAETVTVQIRNAGSTALNFATNPVTVSVAVTGPGTPGTFAPVTLNTGTLAVGATQNVTFTGTANLATVGTYSFTITASTPADGNTANNSLTTTVVVAAPVAGTLSASTTSICVSGTANLTLAGFQNGSVQFQSSTSASGPFANVTGSTGGTFTTPTLTSNIFYRAQVTCGNTVVTSNVVAITVNNPQVISAPAPAAVCAGQTATLTATSAAGTTVRFYSTATGGTALTGATTSGTNPVTTSQVTPVLTTVGTTTFYAEAVSGTQENVGLPAPLGTTSFIATNYGLIFSTTGPTTLASAVIYPTGTGTVTFALQDNTGTDIAVTPAINVTGSGASTPVTVPLNLSVPAAGTGYRLALKAYTGITNLVRDNPLPASSPFPFTSPSGLVSITGGLLGGGPSTTAYYFFYNIQVGTQCVAATRTAIAVTVNPTANANFSYSATNGLCTSQTTAQAVTLATGATAGTFTVSPTTGLTINATTGAITPSTSTPGTYTITNTVATTGSVCGSSATTTVTITAPAVATFSYPAASGTVSYCAGSTGTITPTLGTGATAGTFTISGTGAPAINATTGALNLANATPGTYTVTNTVAASGACAAQTATTTVTVAGLPTATLSAPTTGSTTFCQGSSVVLTAPTGTGLTYQFFNGPTSLGAASTTNTLTVSATGSYSVVVTNASGCTATSTAVAVTVNPLPAIPTLTVTGTPATGLTLTATSTTTGITYQFYRNGVLVTGTTGNTLVVNSGTNNGSYTVVAVSAQGCSSAASAATTVTVTATASASAAASVRLYPNPTPDGRVSVELKGYPAAASLTLLNALGQVVRTLPTAAPNGTTPLDLHELASGVYLLQVQAAGTAPQTLRVVKN